MSRHASFNRAYCLVWSDELQAYVPVPETARRRGKSAGTVIALAMAVLLAAGGAFAITPDALPSGGVVSAGQASISQRGATMTIGQGSARAAIDWQSFNIGSGATVNFVQPSAAAIALNRVRGQDPTQVFGALNANGQARPLLTWWLTPLAIDAGGTSASLVYDGQTHSHSGEASYTESLEPGHLAGSMVYASGRDVGTYGLMAGYYSDQQGYDISLANEGSLTITPAQLTMRALDYTKQYDGSDVATPGQGRLVLDGFVHGEGGSYSAIGNGSYNSKNVNAASSVSFSLAGVTYTFDGSSLAGNYLVPAQSDVTGDAHITPVALTATVTGYGRPYDGTDLIAQTLGHIDVSGFVDGEGGTLRFAELGHFNSKNVSEADTVSFDMVSYGLNEGTLAGNYLPQWRVSGPGTITPLPVQAAMAPVTKVYDGSTGVVLAGTGVSFSGFIEGEGASVAGVRGDFNSKDVRDAHTVTALLEGLLALDGTLLDNYQLPSAVSGSGSITPRPITVGLQNPVTKIADGTTLATLGSLNYTIGNLVAGESIEIARVEGEYDSVEAGSDKLVSVMLDSGDYRPATGILLGNYELFNGGVAARIGVIFPAPAVPVDPVDPVASVAPIPPVAVNPAPALLPPGDSPGYAGALAATARAPAVAEAASVASTGPREQPLFRRAFSTSNGGMRLPDGVRDTETDADAASDGLSNGKK